MYNIFYRDRVLATVSAPNWVKLLDNGCFGLCREEEAEGIAAGGTVYHVIGRPPITGVDDVTLVVTAEDETTYRMAQAEQKRLLESDNAEMLTIMAETVNTQYNADLEELSNV